MYSNGLYLMPDMMATALSLFPLLIITASLVECRGVVDSGSLSYLLSALSSHVSEVRMAATHCLSRFAAHLRTSTSREKPQVRLTLLGVSSSSTCNLCIIIVHVHVYYYILARSGVIHVLCVNSVCVYTYP